MWTARIEDVKKVNGNAHVSVVYTDGQTSISESYSFASPEQLKQTVSNRVAQLEAVDSFVATLEPGDIDLTPAPVPSPTPAPAPDPKRTAFQQARKSLEALQPMVELGVIDESNPDYVAAQQAAKETFDPSYLSPI